MSQFFTNKGDIEQWLTEMNVYDFTINDDLTVDVDAGVELERTNLATLPVQFGKVTAYFDVSNNRLTSLLGCPTFCGNFICFNNKLKSFKGCPEYVYGIFAASQNDIETFEFLPKHISHEMYLDGNVQPHGILNLLLVDGLTALPQGIGGALNKEISDIIMRHLKTKDIFACQQELIDAGYEEYATL